MQSAIRSQSFYPERAGSSKRKRRWCKASEGCTHQCKLSLVTVFLINLTAFTRALGKSTLVYFQKIALKDTYLPGVSWGDLSHWFSDSNTAFEFHTICLRKDLTLLQLLCRNHHKVPKTL